MKTLHALAALAAALFSATAAAQTMKPGLWEITHNMKSGNPETQASMAQAHKEMANMPPEQRRMMQEMMAKQGMQMGAGGPGGSSMRTCMTKEMVARNEMPMQGDCRTTSQSRSGNTTKFAFTCANPPSSGEGEYVLTSAEAYRMRMTVRTSMQGRSETMNMDGSGRWISADCGSVKPMRPPGAK